MLYVIARRLHLLERNLDARKWNRQFLGVEASAEELEHDKADEAFIKSAKRAMGQAQGRAFRAQNAPMTGDEIMEKLNAMGGYEKFKENYLKSLGAH